MILFVPSTSATFEIKRKRCLSHRGFTLIEMLVSVTILVLLMGIIFEIIQMTSQTYKQTTQGTGLMQQARVAFERMTRNISQATLNNYYSYYPASPATPTNYYRQSELQFVSGNGPINGGSFLPSTAGVTQITHAIFFQAPLGITASTDAGAYGNLNSLLNACGYFVVYSQDTFRPSFLSTTTNTSEYRYRLMEFLQPSEYLSIYSVANAPYFTGASSGNLAGWIKNSIPSLTTAQTAPNITVRPLANNIVALIVMPEQYSYSTTTINGQTNTTPLNCSNPSATTQIPYNYDSAYNTQSQTFDSNGNAHQYLTANQLPPLVKVVMVAIDEPSATRLAALNGSTTPDLGNLSTSSPKLFQYADSLFTNNGTEGDLEKLEDKLNSLRLNYYVFQTDVIIRGAKWTTF